ncbi:hypothetical protein SCLCIDRAFT_460033 [Scleroderma citrinum Foug A]|uniref:Uncharacterized protein n=1 Tax=Scleroderma citrinum Foug A TaxID=1036808 RepID=A0A0C3DAL5_9AGAM|nr:hypothetical protein SCLCIDRAFT_460033 [Scleroderma citrinum Foug A]
MTKKGEQCPVAETLLYVYSIPSKHSTAMAYTDICVIILFNEVLVSTVIPETFTLEDLCRQILEENRGRRGIPSGATGSLIYQCQYFKLDPPVHIGDKEDEDIIAECQDVTRLDIPRMTEMGDVVAGAPRRYQRLSDISLAGEGSPRQAEQGPYPIVQMSPNRSCAL